MRITLPFLAAVAAVAQAFRDTSPFLLYSSSASPSSISIPNNTLQSRSQALRAAEYALRTCESDVYILISHPSTSTQEVGQYSPFLSSLVKDGGVVNEVLGMNGGECEELARWIEEKCGGEKKAVLKEFPALSATGAEDREAILRDNDAAIQSTVSSYSDVPYTLIYTTTSSNLAPQKQEQQPVSYQADFQEALHMDLRRDLETRHDRLNSTNSDQRPLFEKYEFFNPGLFMGLLAGAILVAILSVGISAVSSLQVSYGAFDKEMGPAAQKKAQ